MIKFDTEQARACIVPTVARLPMGNGKPDRFAVVGTNYGYIHTTAGDIRTWASYSGARRAARNYVGL
jgi:hypothetical protein